MPVLVGVRRESAADDLLLDMLVLRRRRERDEHAAVINAKDVFAIKVEVLAVDEGCHPLTVAEGAAAAGASGSNMAASAKVILVIGAPLEVPLSGSVSVITGRAPARWARHP